ncbi:MULTISPECIES: FKBP-type peptidyl-prolyl cis-trans isomerase [Persicobacter]|uniref:Peptidyl-prolyl cis-trans isomerase n=1 Tax=Persicobacter diffluens TaxID=981 RepID=A0AAN4VXZ8_9BACT|nr:peptidylprolyl isomerase [Persicobacter sp. CCB-QB2]GJM62091.1 peptidyl-prolyl cis-trans isomerase [Persicobacter diffluens]
MSVAEKGNQVKVHYTGRLTEEQGGTQFDSSAGREPLAFELGAGQMIPGFDAAVHGMAIGDKKTVTIPAAEAYGEARPEMIQKMPRTALPEDMEVAVGQKLYAQAPNGQPFPVTVIELTETEVTIDGNHELAGKDLVFEIELVEIA